MALPSGYTELELAAYMEILLGETARKLNLKSDDGDFDEAVNDVLLVLDRDDLTWVSTRADVKKVRTVARQEAWRVVVNGSAHEVSHSVGAPGTGQTSRSAIHTQAVERLEEAQAETKELYPDLFDESGARSVDNWTVNYTYDYYSNQA
jgi:hypothetical protein